MGCNTSTTASAPAPAGRAGKKASIPGTVDITYFNVGKGRADPLEQLVAHAGQSWKRTSVGFGEGPTSEFGTGLPQTEINGKKYGQLGATLRYLGQRLGYYDPKDFKAARYCDPIVDTWGDVVGSAGGFAFAQDEEAKAAALTKFEDTCTRFHGLVEKNFAHHGGKFVAGNKMTIADFCMASYLGNFVYNPLNPISQTMQGKMDSYPKLKVYAEARETTFPYLKTRDAMTTPF